MINRLMLDKNFNEKQWNKFYLTQRFIQNLLKCKMDIELKKFEEIETAYQNIKKVTGIDNAEHIADKFINSERNYGDLLLKIAEQQ